VHTNRTLKQMVGDGLLRWQAGRLRLRDEARLEDLAEMEQTVPRALPLI